MTKGSKQRRTAAGSRAKAQPVVVVRRSRTATKGDAELSGAMSALATTSNRVSLSSRAYHGSRTRKIAAKYDAAVTNDDNRRHWANSDALSADASATVSIRQTLRNRSRYEVANNS